MRRIAPFLVLLGCDAGAPAPTGPRPDQIAQAEIHEAQTRAQHELDAVAKAVLERYTLDPKSVPDNGLLEHEKTIFVDRDLSYDATGAQLTADALPVGPFALRSGADMQADADRTHDTVHSIFIYSLQIEGDRAKLWVGVHVKIPDVPEGSGTCCCSEQDVYVKRGGVWTFAETTDSICS